jgi:hypothetical protein
MNAVAYLLLPAQRPLLFLLLNDSGVEFCQHKNNYLYSHEIKSPAVSNEES